MQINNLMLQGIHKLEILFQCHLAELAHAAAAAISLHVKFVNKQTTYNKALLLLHGLTGYMTS